MFWRRGEHFINARNLKALAVYQNKNIEGQQVVVWKRDNNWNMRWRVNYLDHKNYRKERGSGYDKTYGFHINRLFYFRSRLPMKRVAEAYSSYVQLKKWKRNRMRYQTWKFDRVSNTIKSDYTRTYSMSIQSSGNGTYWGLATTNSRWW
jgi:hypothetical protein